MILLCKDGNGNVVGVAPFYLRQEVGNCTIHSLGGGDVCTDYLQILSADGWESEVCVAVAKHFAEFCKSHSAVRSQCITIDAVENDTPWLRSFQQETAALGFQNWLQPVMGSFRLTLPQSLDEYVSQLGNSAKRKRKKLTSLSKSGEIAYFSTDDTGDLTTRMCELQRLHQARRAVLHQPGCFADTRFEKFLYEAVDLLGYQGQARIDWCEVNGKTIATHLVLKGTDTLFVYQSGIDPECMKLEPGHLLVIATIERAIQNGFGYYDTLRGNEKYKAYWGCQEILLSRLHCRPPDFLSQVAGFSHYRFWQLKQAAKRILKTTKSFCSVTTRSILTENQS